VGSFAVVSEGIDAFAKSFRPKYVAIIGQILNASGQASVKALKTQLRTAGFNDDEPRDEKGQWTDGGGEKSQNEIDAQVAGLKSVGGDSVRNPLLPKGVEVDGDPDGDNEAIQEHFGNHYPPKVIEAISEAKKDSPGDVRSVPVNQVVSTQATLSLIKLKEYLSSSEKTTDHGIAVRYGKEFILIDGNHRVAAAKIKGQKSVDLKIVADLAKGRNGAAYRVAAPTVTQIKGWDFDTASPDAQDWIEEHATELIDGITKTTRDEIKHLLEQAFEGDYDVDDLTSEITDLIGDDARAETIARTEVMTASNRGQQEAWSQAEDAGLLTGDEKQVWIVTPDDRLCPICEPLEGETAPLGGTFRVEGDDIDGPPAHPRCRCTIGLQA
jgi:hypothetical protein